MKDINIGINSTIRESMRKLSLTGQKSLVVTDKNNKLLGTLSDGDLRKAILKGSLVSDSINGIYTKRPTVLVQNQFSDKEAKSIFTKYKYDLIPIVDSDGKVVDILAWGEIFRNGTNDSNSNNLDISVVIMAGGIGARLQPFTNVLPKPLLPIHDKTVIEHIIERFTKVGVNDFILTVNYKARLLRAYFEELQPEYKVEFLDEREPLGTAGSLRFLEKKMATPFIVTNCDIIIKADYPEIYNFHLKNNYDITLVASTKNYTIPYGTCELNSEGHLEKINEKPQYEFLASTGLYILSPTVLKLIPSGKHFHFTHLIDAAKKNGNRVGVYPIDDEAWIDVGQWDEYQKAVDRI
jgi:dTDP-glucose pyrophosphorylase